METDDSAFDTSTDNDDDNPVELEQNVKGILDNKNRDVEGLNGIFLDVEFSRNSSSPAESESLGSDDGEHLVDTLSTTLKEIDETLNDDNADQLFSSISGMLLCKRRYLFVIQG